MQQSNIPFTCHSNHTHTHTYTPFLICYASTLSHSCQFQSLYLSHTHNHNNNHTPYIVNNSFGSFMRRQHGHLTFSERKGKNVNTDRYHMNVILFIRFVPYPNNNEMTMTGRKMGHTYGFHIKWMLYGNFSFSFWIPSMCV